MRHQIFANISVNISGLTVDKGTLLTIIDDDDMIFYYHFLFLYKVLSGK